MEIVNKAKKCPKCKSGYLEHRTPRGFLVKATLFWLPIRRYRCSTCTKKSYVFGTAQARTEQVKRMDII